jgi:hypothetical protein
VLLGRPSELAVLNQFLAAARDRRGSSFIEIRRRARDGPSNADGACLVGSNSPAGQRELSQVDAGAAGE